MNIEIAIIDNDKSDRIMIENKVFSAFDHLESVSLNGYESIQQLMDSEKSINIDVLFLDIELGVESGIEFAKSSFFNNSKTEIVFVSNMEHLVFEALKTIPLGFIRKQYLDIDLPPVIEAIKKRIRAKNKVLMTKKNGVKLNFKNILYVESNRNYVFIYLSDQVVKERMTLSEFIDKYMDESMYKINKSHLINFNHVTKIQNHEITLSNDFVLRAKSRNYKDLINSFLDYSGKNI